MILSWQLDIVGQGLDLSTESAEQGSRLHRKLKSLADITQRAGLPAVKA